MTTSCPRTSCSGRPSATRPAQAIRHGSTIVAPWSFSCANMARKAWMFAGISQVRETFTPQLRPHEVGTITNISTGIARVSGLPGVGFEELLEFPGGVFGIAFNVDEEEIGVVLLGDYWHVHAGDEVERTGRVMDVAVGDGLLGRVIDPLGRPLDDSGPMAASKRLPIERPAAPIMDR